MQTDKNNSVGSPHNTTDTTNGQAAHVFKQLLQGNASLSDLESAQAKARHSISPYPPHITIKGDNVFSHGKYAGYVDKVQNWGTDFLARPVKGFDNAFFRTKTEAVFYLASHLNNSISDAVNQ